MDDSGHAHVHAQDVYLNTYQLAKQIHNEANVRYSLGAYKLHDSGRWLVDVDPRECEVEKIKDVQGRYFGPKGEPRTRKKKDDVAGEWLDALDAIASGTESPDEEAAKEDDDHSEGHEERSDADFGVAEGSMSLDGSVGGEEHLGGMGDEEVDERLDHGIPTPPVHDVDDTTSPTGDPLLPGLECVGVGDEGPDIVGDALVFEDVAIEADCGDVPDEPPPLPPPLDPAAEGMYRAPIEVKVPGGAITHYQYMQAGKLVHKITATCACANHRKHKGESCRKERQSGAHAGGFSKNIDVRTKQEAQGRPLGFMYAWIQLQDPGETAWMHKWMHVPTMKQRRDARQDLKKGPQFSIAL